MGAPIAPTYTVNHYEFYASDGTTQVGTADLQTTLDTDTVYYCVMSVFDTTANKANDVTIQWQFNLAGGGWTTVGTTTAVQFANGSLTDGDTTQTAKTAETGTFQGSRVYESANTTAIVWSTPGDETDNFGEHWLGFTIDSAQVSDGQEVLLRATLGDGTAFDVYNVNADIDINAPATVITSSISSGAYTLTGSAIDSLYNRRSAISTGSYTLTGSAVATMKSYRSAISTGAYTLTGSVVGSLYDRISSISSGSYALTGYSVTTSKTYKSQISSGSYALTGSNISSLYDRVSQITAGSFALTGQTIDGLYNHTSGIASGSYSWSGSAIDSKQVFVSSIAAGSLALSGSEVNSLYNHITGIAAGSYTWSGAAVSSVVTYVSSIAADSYTWLGIAVESDYNHVSPVQSGTYALTGYDITSEKLGGGVTTSQISAGNFTLSHSSVDTLYHSIAKITSGAYVITANDIATIHQYFSQINPAAYSLVGSSVATLHHYLTDIQAAAYLITWANIDTIEPLGEESTQTLDVTLYKNIESNIYAGRVYGDDDLAMVRIARHFGPKSQRQ